MTRFARHLQHHPIVNPFPGLVKLEAAIGRPIAARIGSNESLPIAAPPLLELFGAAAAELARLYPDPYAHGLRCRAAALNGVAPAEIVFDTGADSLILLTLRLFCDVGDTVLATAGTYPTFRYFAEGCGLAVTEVGYRADAATLAPDLATLAEAAHRHAARLVYLANPDNPSGHYHDAAAIRAFRAALPADTVLLLDEAYVDFCTAPDDAPPAGALPNTVRLRTLSKAYGLAGLRVGYAIAAPDVVAKADQIRPQFALSSLAQAAAAALFDAPDYSRQLVDATLALRATLSAELAARGLAVLPSHTNFVSIVHPDAATAERIQRALLDEGVAVHRPPHPAVRQLLRVTAHPQALAAAVLDALAS